VNAEEGGFVKVGGVVEHYSGAEVEDDGEDGAGGIVGAARGTGDVQEAL
jgi:hypothetical protein